MQSYPLTSARVPGKWLQNMFEAAEVGRSLPKEAHKKAVVLSLEQESAGASQTGPQDFQVQELTPAGRICQVLRRLCGSVRESPVHSMSLCGKAIVGAGLPSIDLC